MGSGRRDAGTPWRPDAAWIEARRAEDARADAMLGFDEVVAGREEVGWLLNLKSTTVQLQDEEQERAALELYFLRQDGSCFKANVLHEPYFFIIVADGMAAMVKTALESRFAEDLVRVDVEAMEDLDMPGHLSGAKRELLKPVFRNVQQLMTVRQHVQRGVRENQRRARLARDGGAAATAGAAEDGGSGPLGDVLEACEELREHDVKYDMRVSIDLGIHAGCWYAVQREDGGVGATVRRLDLVEKAEPRILAFDIECAKEDLKFPDPEHDPVFMISYMMDGQGYLIVSREFVSEDIRDFEYSPKAEFPGPFRVFNEADEAALLRRFFAHCRELRPNVWVTYNGDGFDWPYLDERAKKHGMQLATEVGVSVQADKTYSGRGAVHMDCLAWVDRDSYLPQGSRGLKKVTRAKLGYAPVEVDPEDMVRLAREQPHVMATYSVSDALATYYLFVKYINLFVFSLCTIIPMGPDDVLRKGSGTLCESLLMVEAQRKRILCPNKHKEAASTLTKDGRLLDEETYVGGHVESLEAGVFRDDLPEVFSLDAAAFQELINRVDSDLRFALEEESATPVAEVTNYAEVRAAIVTALEGLRDRPSRTEKPSIYHLDVSAMYPNIILTNRLQPSAMVGPAACAACEHNTSADADCKRRMTWSWRAVAFTADKREVQAIQTQLESETHGEEGLRYHELDKQERAKLLKQRTALYSRRSHGTVRETLHEDREVTVCQRENPFYVDTVRAFRDRRYEYKRLTKRWAKESGELAAKGDDPMAEEEARNKVLLYDSLQLAHKCILNSFYGYVMRKGARWRSIEMAGVVTHTGGNIIKRATTLVRRVGRPLELDTDGIWCILPASFPENFTFTTRSGGKVTVSYPCVMLNADVARCFSNHQYQDRAVGAGGGDRFEKRSECSISFEVDGPYRCMMLPASETEGVLLKKRYAVFDMKGRISELKGFEVKRRGELKIVQRFQEQVFSGFLQGESLEECYEAVGAIASTWMEVLESRGGALSTAEVIELISTASKANNTLAEFAGKKMLVATAARRLAEFLQLDGDAVKGMFISLIIARGPAGASVTERAVPVKIFSADEETKRRFLCKWMGDRSLDNFDVRNIVDWAYYKERLSANIRKIITIPAGLQGVQNPVPLVSNPPWLEKALRDRLDAFKQKKLAHFFPTRKPQDPPLLADLEDAAGVAPIRRPAAPLATSTAAAAAADMEGEADEDRAQELVPMVDDEEEEKEEQVADESDFDGWLKNRKVFWSKLAEARRAQTPAPTARRRANIDQFVVGEKDITAGDFYWQVLEVREQRTPGLFQVFVMPSPNEVRSIFVQVPRRLYLNLVRPDDSELPPWIERTKVSKMSLPHGQACQHLYRIEMDEASFQAHAKEREAFLNRPEVAGVFEMQVPLLARLVAHLGCVARLEHTARSRPRDRRHGTAQAPFRLAEVERLDCSADRAYLAAPKAEYRRIFAFVAGKRGRLMVALFIVDQSSSELEALCREQIEAEEDEDEDEVDGGEVEVLRKCLRVSPRTARCHVWLADERGGQPVRPSMGRQLAQLLEPLRQQGEATVCELEDGPAVTACKSRREAFRGADAVLQSYLASRMGPTLVLLQSSTPKPQLIAQLPALSELPCVGIPASSGDDELPPLQWQGELAKRAVHRYLEHSIWWLSRIKCASYGQVPVGYVETDVSLGFSDIMLMRQLEHNKHVLWATTASAPDLGGLESDCVHLEELTAEEEAVEVTRQGAYRSVCVEVDLFYLAVAAVVQADNMDSGEAIGLFSAPADALAGGAQTLAADGSLIKSSLVHKQMLGEGSKCLQAFKLLRRTVEGWVKDARRRFPLAQLVTEQFYRWLCSPDSLFFDPGLYRYVHRLMRKLFNKLLALVASHGGEVVHASFHKLWICTGKADVRSARSFCDGLAQAASDDPLFRDLSMRQGRFWHVLVFLDPENYGGVIVDDALAAADAAPGSPSPSLKAEEGEEAEAEAEAERETGVAAAGAKRKLEDAAAHQDADCEDAELLVPEEAAADDEGGDERPRGKLRRRNDAGGAVTGESRRRVTLASEQERVRRYKAGLDDDDDESDEGGNSANRSGSGKTATQKQDGDDMDDMDDFIVDDGGDDFYEDPEERRQREELGDNPLALQSHRQRKQQEQQPQSKFQVEVNWNIAQHLPAELQDYFVWIVAEFILEPVKFRDEWFEKLEQREAAAAAQAAAQAAARAAEGADSKQATQQAEQVRQLAASSLSVRVIEEDLLEAEASFLKQLVGKTLLHKVLRLVPKIVAAEGSFGPFPTLPGSHLDLHNPALMFVKCLHRVLSLDETLDHEVVVFRRSLLRLLGVGEFDPEAEFRDPSLSLVVRDLICDSCHDCMDVDICRNQHLKEQFDAAEPGERGAWRCATCTHPFNMAAVEAMLVRRVERLALAYQLQDLKCTKCGAIRANVLRDNCTCAGPWAFTVSPDDQHARLEPFVRAAKYYAMPLLLEAAQAAQTT